MESLYQKYDLEFEYMGSKGNEKYTKQEVEEELAILEETLKSIEKVTYSEEIEITDTNRNISPRFIYERTYNRAVLLMNPPVGGATIEISCKAKINDSTISFVDVYDIKTRQYGLSGNFVSWDQNSSSYSYSDGKKKAAVTASGTLVIEGTVLNQVFRITRDHDIVLNIVAS